MRSKRGSEKYYIIISLILGLMVLGLALYFIFFEFFTEDDINWEQCRQSIVLRNAMPNADRPLKTDVEKLKNQIPLKCKNQVIEVDSTDFNEVFKIIADSMVQGWYLFGEGNYHIYPINHIKERKDCPIFSRIHFSEQTKKHFAPYELDIAKYLVSHNLDGSEIPEKEWKVVEDDGRIRYKLVDGSYAKYLRYKGQPSLVLADNDQMDKGEYGMRQKIEVTKGDLLVGVYFYSNPEINILGNVLYKYSYPFYFQSSVDDIGKCAIETIPA